MITVEVTDSDAWYVRQTLARGVRQIKETIRDAEVALERSEGDGGEDLPGLIRHAVENMIGWHKQLLRETEDALSRLPSSVRPSDFQMELLS